MLFYAPEIMFPRFCVVSPAIRSRCVFVKHMAQTYHYIHREHSGNVRFAYSPRKKTTKPIHTHTARHETLCSLITTPLALCCLNEAKQCNLKIKNPTTVPRQIKRKYINYNEKKKSYGKCKTKLKELLQFIIQYTFLFN